MSELLNRWCKPDGWAWGGYLGPSDWDKAEYRLTPNNSLITSLAVNIRVSGGHRKIHGQGTYGHRCQITFVGDGEPDIIAYGWVEGYYPDPKASHGS